MNILCGIVNHFVLLFSKFCVIKFLFRGVSLLFLGLLAIKGNYFVKYIAVSVQFQFLNFFVESKIVTERPAISIIRSNENG